MKNFIVAALAALVATVASAANARDDEPSWKAVEEYASNYMQQLKEQNMSERETANQLALPILLLCERAQGSLRLSSTPRYMEHDVRPGQDRHINTE